jgi:hypothetical protein
MKFVADGIVTKLYHVSKHKGHSMSALHRAFTGLHNVEFHLGQGWQYQNATGEGKPL